MTELEQQIVMAIASLKSGEVVTYGEIARRAGNPKAPRAVGRLLSKADLDLPWWRVIRSDRTLLSGQSLRQTKLLEQEGVKVAKGRVIQSPLGCFSDL
ncbi:MAG: MGMT family protein [Pirellulaceae bacterium]